MLLYELTTEGPMITKEQLAQALKAPDYRAAAGLLGVHWASVHRLIRRHGLERPAHWRGVGRLKGSTNGDIRQMRRAAAAAESYAELGRTWQVTRQAAREMCIRHNLALGGKKSENG